MSGVCLQLDLELCATYFASKRHARNQEWNSFLRTELQERMVCLHTVLMGDAQKGETAGVVGIRHPLKKSGSFSLNVASEE
jgi:hypothetical protein